MNDKIKDKIRSAAYEYACYGQVHYGSGEFDARTKHFEAGATEAINNPEKYELHTQPKEQPQDNKVLIDAIQKTINYLREQELTGTIYQDLQQALADYHTQPKERYRHNI